MNKTEYPRLEETVYRARLNNGLKVIVVKRPGFLRSCAYLVTEFGSVHTQFRMDGIPYVMPPGVAHYLEHRMFDLPGRDVNGEFAALGASANAFTSYDMTAYYFSGTEHFEECLELLLEFVTTPFFPEEAVEKERSIIAQEIAMYLDSPDAVVFDQMCWDLYRHHPLRHPITGTEHSVEQITAGMLEVCYEAFYHPGNMTLCVMGDVDEQTVLEIAQRRTPDPPRPKVVVDLGPEEQMKQERDYYCQKMDVAMPTFQMGFKCEPGRTGEEFARWELTAELACEALMGESSELYQRMYEQGLIDSAFGWGVETITGSAMILAGGDSDHPRQVRDEIIAQAARLAKTGIGEEEFRRMCRSFLGRRMMDLDSFESTCFRLCAYGYEDFDYLRFPELFDRIRKEDLIPIWRDYFHYERCTLSVVEPFEKQKGDE